MVEREKDSQKEWFHGRNRFAGAAAAPTGILLFSRFPAVCTEDATIAQDRGRPPVRVLCGMFKESGLTFVIHLDHPVLLKALQSRMGPTLYRTKQALNRGDWGSSLSVCRSASLLHRPEHKWLQLLMVELSFPFPENSKLQAAV